MRKSLPLIAVGLAAFALTLIFILPATLISVFLPPSVALDAPRGTFWSGASDAVSVNGNYLGALRWRLRPLQVLRGRLAVDLELTRPDGQATGRLAAGLGQRIHASNVRLNLPLHALNIGAAPKGWSGNLQATLAAAEIRAGELERIVGTIELRSLQAPSTHGASVGSYRVSFDEAANQAEKITGQLQDLEGPMQVSGTVILTPGHNYAINGLVAPRAGASPAVVNTLRYLGRPDAQGRRIFGMQGTY